MKLEAAWKDEKGDIIVKYTAEEARSLKNYNELPDNASWTQVAEASHLPILDGVVGPFNTCLQ